MIDEVDTFMHGASRIVTADGEPLMEKGLKVGCPTRTAKIRHSCQNPRELWVPLIRPEADQ
jgi:hypothetical protein